MKLPYKHIMAVFEGSGREYAYFVPMAEEVKEDDWILVWVRNNPTLAKVTRTSGITKAERDKANKVIGCVVGGLDDWKAEMEKLKEYLDFRSKLAEMREQYDEMQVFTALAANNPEAQELLSKMNQTFGMDIPTNGQITNDK